MLSPHDMSSVIIAGPNNILEGIIKELHNLKILHIVDHSKNDLADIGTPLESASRISEILVKVRSMISSLNIKKNDSSFELKRDILDVGLAVKKLGDELAMRTDELKKIEEHLSRNEAVKQELEILKGIDIPLELF